MKSIAEIITSYNPKSICWYPSAGLDVQIIDTYLHQAEQVNAIQPDFFIFSDRGYWVDNDGDVKINRDNGPIPIDTNDFISIETFRELENFTISRDYINYFDRWIDFKVHNDIIPIDRTDDFFADKEWMDSEDLDIVMDTDTKEEDKQNVIKQFLERLSKTGVMYKRNNIHVLFLAVDNTEIYNLLQGNTAINSVIYNSPGPWVMPADGLKKLKVREICSGGTQPGMLYLPVNDERERIGNQFKWRGDNHLDGDVGNILRVTN